MTEGERQRVIYILSSGRSGSTLLAMLLATHPEIASIGERRFVLKGLRNQRADRNSCLCGAFVPDCEFLSELYAVGQRRLFFFQRNTDFLRFRTSSIRKVHRGFVRLARMSDYGYGGGFLSSLLSAPFRRVCEANLAVMDFVLAAQGGSVFLDSSKIPADLRHMTSSRLFDITIIHLMRDGRARYYSLLHHGLHRSMEEAAHEVKSWDARVDQVLREWKGPVIRVRYEELCRRPLEELRRIATEAGLETDGMTLDFLDSCPHLIGNARLIRSTSNEVVNREEWRHVLHAEQLEVFEQIAGESNRSLGYTD